MLHAHITFVVLYVLFFLIKLIMLFVSSPEQLARFRKKTRILEMILPTLFLITGVMLAINSAHLHSGWFALKIVLLVLSIVLGIFTFRKNSRILGIITLLLFVYIILISFTKSYIPFIANAVNSEDTGNKVFTPGAADYDPLEHGQYLFSHVSVQGLSCESCHGMAGDKGLSNAADLTKSSLDDAAIRQVIKGGKMQMPSFAHLSDQELDALTVYVKSLRK